MDFTGAAARYLAIMVCATGLAGCALVSAPPADGARAGFCVGIDKEHPADSRTTVTFVRGGQTLGMVGNVVTGPVSIPVTPGEVTVLVDGKAATTMTVSSGSTAYATSGTGCPARP
jgi:hypothetical protein